MKKVSKLAFPVVLFAIIFGFGILSAYNLGKFYVKDEVYNNEWSPELGTKFETDIATTFFQKWAFLDYNGLMKNCLGQREMNGVVKLNNGYLLSPVAKTSDEALTRYADKVAELNAYLEDKGIALVYVATPYTSSKYDPQLPAGVDDYGNENIDRFVVKLNERNVDTIDIRERMYEQNIDHYSMMYRTDHHWNTRAGLFAYGEIEKYIRDEKNCQIDPRVADINQYKIDVYKENHLGSNGQRTGRLFARPDDFELIQPKFDTQVRNADGVLGSVSEVVLNPAAAANQNMHSRYTYDYVLDKTMGSFENLNSKNDLRILIVSDSFGKAVNPYLIMGFREVKFVKDVESADVSPELIERYQPDVVILLYYSALISDDSKYLFNYKGF